MNNASWYTDDNRRPHHDLDVWTHGKNFALEIYRVTGQFPDHEKYGLTSQLRRAAVSVPSNIAEGAARNTRRDFLRFLYNARGSLEEIDTQLEIAGELGHLSEDDVEQLREHFAPLSQTLGGLIRSMNRKIDR